MFFFFDDKEFFMGFEFLIIDCMMFGFLLCFLYMVDSLLLVKVVKEDLKNLVDFCDWMKFNFWFDWNELCLEE